MILKYGFKYDVHVGPSPGNITTENYDLKYVFEYDFHVGPSSGNTSKETYDV